MYSKSQNAGYTCLAKDLTRWLPKKFRKKYVEAIDGGNLSAVLKILEQAWSKEYAPYKRVFKVTKNFVTRSPWKEGDIIITFDDENLYVEVETKQFKKMKRDGIELDYSTWGSS